MSKYNKLWVALIAAVGVLVAVMAPSTSEAAFTVTRNEWYMIVVAFAGALGVYAAPNSKE